MRFTRMHGAGNSFVLIELPDGTLPGGDLAVLARTLCRQQTTDGLIAVCPAGSPGADLSMLFYNADGSTGEMCGNGARCLARYAVEHGLAPDPDHIRIRAAAGTVTARRLSRELYEVRLNDPSVVDLHRPAFDGERLCDCAYLELGEPGIPHAVVSAAPEDLDDPDRLRSRGRALRHDGAFPRGANVSFACLSPDGSVRAVTYERGVEDLTLACGTGCGAIAAALMLRGDVPGPSLSIDMPGGRLGVTLRLDRGRARDILLTGPTAVTGEGDTDAAAES